MALETQYQNMKSFNDSLQPSDIATPRPPLLCHSTISFAQGVFFILATKVVSVPASCGGGRLCERRIHTLTTDDLDSDDEANALEGPPARKTSGGHEEEEDEVEEKGLRQAPSRENRDGGAGGSRPTTPLRGNEEDRRGGEGERRGSTNRNIDGPKSRTDLDLPPRHWMCTVCKKVRRCFFVCRALDPPCYFPRLVVNLSLSIPPSPTTSSTTEPYDHQRSIAARAEGFLLPLRPEE